MSGPEVFENPRDERDQRRRVSWFLLAAYAVLGLLAARLWQLQVVEGQQYRRLAAQQSSRTRPMLPQRGLLLDRTGRVLVDNQPGLRLRFYPDQATNPAQTTAFLRQALSFPPTDLAEKIRTAMRRRPFRPETLVKQLTRDDLARIDAHQYEHPELQVQTAPLRRYPHGSRAAHIFGYLGEIDDEALAEEGHLRPYAAGDIVGKTGIERRYDPWLFGTKGRERFRVDANGRIRELVDTFRPRPGWDLKLAIDWPTQIAAEEALGDRAGAVVALDPRSGEVLAMATHPSFDPATFVGGISSEDWARLRDNPQDPLEHRPIRGLYSPGSTIKPLVALAGLAADEIEPDETVYCPGYYRLGRRTFRCWKAGGHGEVDLYKAIVESCDTYFYELGNRLGIERLAAFFRKVGLGSPSGIDLGGEKAGLVPDPAWKQRRSSEPWQGGETIITAIGQGSLLTTPLQLARLFALFANRGHLVTPHLRQGFENTERPAAAPAPAAIPGSTAVDLDPDDLRKVVDALEGVVADRRGTGGWARIRGVRVAGKTGTVQVIRQERRGEELAENLRDHAWFAAFAPVEDPRIAVAVIVEHGGHGSDAAAPVARRVIRTFLDQPVTVARATPERSDAAR